MARKKTEDFLDSLDKLRENQFIQARGRLKGDVKNKFITELKQTGNSIDKQTNIVFKYYYDNHPNKMSY